MSRGKTEKIVATGLASVAATVGRLAMDCCLYINQNFGFISFPAELTTGSSIMPHKKNPDVFELIRAKCNRIQAAPNELTLLLTNLPSGYHRDLQLTKEILFPALEEGITCLRMTRLMLSHIQIRNGILEDEKYKYLFSVEAVNQLVNQGVPFREAYQQVGNDIDREISISTPTNSACIIPMRSTSGICPMTRSSRKYKKCCRNLISCGFCRKLLRGTGKRIRAGKNDHVQRCTIRHCDHADDLRRQVAGHPDNLTGVNLYRLFQPTIFRFLIFVLSFCYLRAGPGFSILIGRMLRTGQGLISRNLIYLFFITCLSLHQPPASIMPGLVSAFRCCCIVLTWRPSRSCISSSSDIYSIKNLNCRFRRKRQKKNSSISGVCTFLRLWSPYSC